MPDKLPEGGDETLAQHLGRPFEPYERRDIRQTVGEYKTIKFLVRVTLRILAWSGGVIAAVYATRDLIAKILHAIVMVFSS